mmetsp:Transcript_12985/g.43934  ORF Transcript_12985/g.43934 Transcript_12985/m.43934 type:complete len:308 (+) Transcript_12985:53-976(+)|eukprot:CAMPEP_0198419854 /NCGR_PEP_ID=MMETSP1452-20131203/471_1 /TAXON_ID=1181717 /ORGANISM="Synchroma pusillum, Strain CCMP3072" /LENGTH=307 /DNA_ID=CAMNT_0044139991 /DNA_START=45 /DNA_END=968 /DNA_ORIENTATION=-
MADAAPASLPPVPEGSAAEPPERKKAGPNKLTCLSECAVVVVGAFLGGLAARRTPVEAGKDYVPVLGSPLFSLAWFGLLVALYPFVREFKIRFAAVSGIQAATVVAIALYAVNDNPSEEPWLMYTVLQMAGGFLVYDSITKPLHESFVQGSHRFDAVMLAHHVSASALMNYMAYLGDRNVCILGLHGILCAEPSTPFLNIRFILRYVGLSGTFLSSVNDLVFAFVFFMARLVYGFELSFIRTWRYSGHGEWLFRASGATLYLASAYWMTQIIGVVIKGLKKTSENKRAAKPPAHRTLQSRPSDLKMD